MRLSSGRWTLPKTAMRGRASKSNHGFVGKEVSGSDRHEVLFGKRSIPFRLKRTARRTLGITVKPDATVVVTAPVGTALETVLSRIRKRAAWIRRQQEYFE